MEHKLRWCFGLKDGLRIVEPNARLSASHLKEAQSSLARAEKNFHDGDFLWATVVMYYAEYYALYSFLQSIGIKCENHFCSILAVSHLLGKNKTEIIERHKDKRIDAQYYMKVDKEEQVRSMLQEAKLFFSMFDDLVSNLREHDIEDYRKKLGKTFK